MCAFRHTAYTHNTMDLSEVHEFNALSGGNGGTPGDRSEHVRAAAETKTTGPRGFRPTKFSVNNILHDITDAVAKEADHALPHINPWKIVLMAVLLSFVGGVGFSIGNRVMSKLIN